MQERYGEYAIVDDDIECPRDLAEDLLLSQLIVMFLKDIEVPFAGGLIGILRIYPGLHICLGFQVGYILYIIETSSFGLGNDTAFMKDLFESDIFLS